MSKKIVDPDTSSDNVNSSAAKSNYSLTNDTKMFIIPPNILQNICISDSTVKDGSITSVVDAIKKDNTISSIKMQEQNGDEISTCTENSTNLNIVIKPTTVVKMNKNNSMDDTNNESLKNAIKVPKNNRDDEKLLPRVNHTEEVKSNHTNTKKQKDNIQVDNSVSEENLLKIKCVSDNVKNNHTTSNDIPKPQRRDSVSAQSSSKKCLDKDIEVHERIESKYEINENLLGRSKRIRKQTKFDDYIVSYKKENKSLNQKEKRNTFNNEVSCSFNNEQKDISDHFLSHITKVNELNHTKCTKGELQGINGKDTTNSNTSLTSVTPAVTKKSLPLNSSNNSENYSTVTSNENNFNIKRLENSEDVVTDKVEELKDTLESNSTNGTEVHMGATNTSTSEHDIKKENDTLDSLNQSKIDQITVTPPVVRKRGRPRKVLPEPLTPNISDVSKDNLETSQRINNVSIAETVIHSKRHNNRSYNICNNDDLSDDNSIEDNIPNSDVRNGDSSPARTSVSRGRGGARGRGRGKGRGRGRSRGRGRGRGSKEMSYSSLDTEYVPKLKGPDKVKQGKSNEVPTSEVESVICAKCETEIPIKQWNSHNLFKHNNMSWVKGDEPLDFENDIKLWKRVLTHAISKRKGQLSCEKCGITKRSVNGFISHSQFCGKSDEERRALMASCPICGAVMMPSSMEIHERTHRQAEQSKVKELQIHTIDNDRVKRKAAEKAVSKILEFTELVKDNGAPPEKKIKLEPSSMKSVIKTPKQGKNIPAVWKGIWKRELMSQGTASCRQINCTFKCTSFQEICKHFTECSFAPRECYVCKICKLTTTSNEDMTKHVAKEHPMMEETEQYSEYEEENCSSDESKETSFKINFLNGEHKYKIRWDEPYHPALLWTIEFERKNYELDLFTDCTPNCLILLNNSDAAKYLPELEISMKMKTENVADKSCKIEAPWKQWKRFEGGLDKGIGTFFVGGPVWALAWLPIPVPMHSKRPSQYIAVSTHPTMESEYTIGKSYLGCNIIQIWNVGPLDHESNSKRESPTLAYAITHNSGTVWCLEWCPSGCYQDESLNNYKKEAEMQSSLKRIGMLAAACSDGSVHIYSLPFPEEVEFKKTTDNEWPIYNTDPVMTLVVNISMHDNNDQNWQCTKLSWIKEHGHNTIAAGFSNGYIALWDLTYKSPLSMQKKRNTLFINAFQYFYAHGNAVSMVALVPYNGKRFLASGSLDKSYKFWDLENTSSPQNCLQKGIIVNGTWMTHWPCAIVSFDDALGYKHTNSYVIPLREHDMKFYPLLATDSPTYALAVSDHVNGIAHGTLAGEVLTIFPHQVMQSKELDKASQKKKKLSSFIKVTDFSQTENDRKDDKQGGKNSKDYHYLPQTYIECKDRFGIIFCDNLKNVEKYSRKSICSEKLTAVPVEEYSFMSVNRMSWNPNMWSYLWLAAGYQNGLVRLLSFKYIPMTREFKTLLSQHAQFMLNKSETVKKCYTKNGT